MLNSVYLCLGFFALNGVTTAAEQQKPLSGSTNPLTPDFGKHVVKLLEQWHVPGLSIGVVDGDDTWLEVSCSCFSKLWWDFIFILQING